jgi:hypothetical protein
MHVLYMRLTRNAAQECATQGVALVPSCRAQEHMLCLGDEGRGLKRVTLAVRHVPTTVLRRASLLHEAGSVVLVAERSDEDPGALVLLTADASWHLSAHHPGVREVACGYRAQAGLGCRMGRPRIAETMFRFAPGEWVICSVANRPPRRLSWDGRHLRNEAWLPTTVVQ